MMRKLILVIYSLTFVCVIDNGDAWLSRGITSAYLRLGLFLVFFIYLFSLLAHLHNAL